MKTLNAKVAFECLGLAKPDLAQIKEVGWKAIFEIYLLGALQLMHPQGVPLPKGRILNRILTKLDNAGEDGIILLEEAEWELVYTAFTREESAWQPSQFKVLCAILNRLEETREQEKNKDGAGNTPH